MQSTQSVLIGLGTINIPARLYVATDEDRGIDFHEYHVEDGARIRRHKVCEQCGKEVKSSEIVKGFEFNGRVLNFTESEIDALRPVSSKAMKIDHFARLSEIPIIAMGKPYFVGTGKESDGASGDTFALLRESMRRDGKVAVVTWVSRGKEHHGILMPHAESDALLLKSVLYADQVRSSEGVEVLEGKLTTATLEKGVKVVRAMSRSYDHSKYHETFSESIAELIKAKAKGKAVPVEKMVAKANIPLDTELDNIIAFTSAPAATALAMTENIAKPAKKTKKTAKK
jgi:DNA end-binding protein Ku